MFCDRTLAAETFYFTIVFAGFLARDDKTSLLLAHTSRRSHSVLDLCVIIAQQI